MLSLRGNRHESYSDSDDDSYSSFDESMQSFQTPDVAGSASQSINAAQSSGNMRRQHDFLKRDSDGDQNSSDDMDDTTIVSKLQRTIDSVDKNSYDLMSAVRSKDWKSAINIQEEMIKSSAYINSQGAPAPYSFLSALKFSWEFFQQGNSKTSDDDASDFITDLRQETPKELRKSLSDFHRTVKEKYDEYASKIERMDDDEEDGEESEESDTELEKFLELSESANGGSLDDASIAAMLGDKSGFSLSSFFTNEELSEESIMSKIQELRLKISGGLTEKSAKENEKILKRMKRSRNVYFSVALQSILSEVERLGLFPKSQVVLCALLFADCFGERRKNAIQKHIFKDFTALSETFPSLNFTRLTALDESEQKLESSPAKDSITLRQWMMAAEYFVRYLSIIGKNDDLLAVIIQQEELIRSGRTPSAGESSFGMEISGALLSPFTLALRLMEEYVEVLRATELHEKSYLGWLQAESILLFVIDSTLRLYEKVSLRGKLAEEHHHHTQLIASNALFLLHYRTADVHAQIYDRYYKNLLTDASYIKRDISTSMQALVGLFASSKTGSVSSLELRAVLYYIHNLAINNDLRGAVSIFHSARCDDRIKEMASEHTVDSAEDSARIDAENLTRVMYNRVLAVIGTALFQQGRVQQAGQYLLALYLPIAQQWATSQYGIFTKELLLAQLSLKHQTALRFSSLPSLQGEKHSEPTMSIGALQASLEKTLQPSMKTHIEEAYLPPHLHLNSELLDCIFFVFCMMHHDNTQRRGANRYSNDPKLYKSFLHGYERQNFLNSPKTNKDLIYAAIVAFRAMDWKTCCTRIGEIPIFDALFKNDQTSQGRLELETTIKTECLKKFLQNARGVFSCMEVEHLAQKFGITAKEVRQCIFRMLAHRELHGFFTTADEAVFKFDHSHHSALQRAILQLSERVLSTVEGFQRAQEFKHMQSLYGHSDSFSKGKLNFRNRQQGRGRMPYDGGANAEEHRMHPDGGSAMSEFPTQRNNEPRKLRGGTVRHAPAKNPFATLRGNRFISR